MSDGGDSVIQCPLHIVPISFREACNYVKSYHRHHKPPAGMKFCIGVSDNSYKLRGVALCGRPVARHYDDGYTIEVNRTCTDGCPNANSALYGACRKIAFAMGYRRIITYTQEGESGASLRGAGYTLVGKREARDSWSESTGALNPLRKMRDSQGTGGVERALWECRK